MLVGDFNTMPGSVLMHLALDGRLDLDDPASLPAVPNPYGGQMERAVLNRRLVDGQEMHNGERALAQGIAEQLAADAAATASLVSQASAAAVAITLTQPAAAAMAPVDGAAFKPTASTMDSDSVNVSHHDLIDVTSDSAQQPK